MVGKITVITGPMFSEKTGELIKRILKMETYGGMTVRLYKPTEDIRWSAEEVVSRIGYRYPAVNIPGHLPDETVNSILQKAEQVDVFAFDEAQFFGERIVDLVQELSYMGKQVLLDGLNMDYRGKVFGSMGDLMAIADEIIKLTAYCAVCKSPDASFTQRIVNGKPAKEGPVVLIGDSESYEPRCKKCFVPPHKIF